MSELLDALLADSPKKSTEVLALRIPQDMAEKLEKIAEKTGRTKTSVVKAMIESCLKEIEL